MTRVFLGLGSNQMPVGNLQAGLAELRQRYQVVGESPWYVSPAVGFDGPDFINLVIEIETDLSLGILSQQLKSLETEFGRPDDAVKFSSRNLDIDILLYGQAVGTFGRVTLPRKDIYKYAFVLHPLLDLSPELLCPETGKPVSGWLSAVSKQEILSYQPSASVTVVAANDALTVRSSALS